MDMSPGVYKLCKKKLWIKIVIIICFQTLSLWGSFHYVSVQCLLLFRHYLTFKPKWPVSFKHFTVKSSNFMSTTFCGLTAMDMFMDTWIGWFHFICNRNLSVLVCCQDLKEIHETKCPINRNDFTVLLNWFRLTAPHHLSIAYI